MIGFSDPNLLNELIDQSRNPPGKDSVIGNFYAAIVEMLEESNKIWKIFVKVKKTRTDITNKHLVNLIFRSFQAIKLEQKDLTYRFFTDTKNWRKELNLLESDDKLREKFEDLLLTRTTTTTIYQRYAGPYVIISYLWENRKVSIADLGCGGNYGLRGIELKEPFKAIRDLTPKKMVSRLLNQKINLKRGMAFDKEKLDLSSSKLWRIACSFYPQELDQIESILRFEDRISSSVKVEFSQTNLLNNSRKLPFMTDIVILSTILYQLNLADQLTIIKKAKSSLKKGGIIIVQDFAHKSLINSNRLDFSKSWFGKKYGYRTFIIGDKTDWRFWEILQWDSGRCKDVKQGEDYDKFFSV